MHLFDNGLERTKLKKQEMISSNKNLINKLIDKQILKLNIKVVKYQYAVLSDLSITTLKVSYFNKNKNENIH